jgi:DNA polymerase-1
MKRILFDCEGDGLLETLTKLHCICTVDVDTGEEREFGPAECNDVFGEAIEYLGTADVLYAHFGLRYDFPAIEKVTGWKVPFEKQRDTVVLSRIRYPNLKESDTLFNRKAIAEGHHSLGQLTGRHSLEAWGIRLGAPKLHTDIEDWSQWTPEIQARCMGDVRTNLKLLKALKVEGIPEDVVMLEHWIDFITDQMAWAGWKFDVAAAGKLHVELCEKRDELEKKLKAEFGGWYAPSDGKQPFVPKSDNKRYGYVRGQPCTKIKWIEFNPQSRQHIERCLKKLGWKPTEFTDSGQAKLDEEVLEGLAALYPQAAGLTDYMTVCKRIGQLAEGEQAWLKKVDSQGFIHGKVNPIGTVTFRAAHYDPNLGQVPAARSLYGHECRALFTVPKGWKLVGADMESLEGRCQAHYQWPFDDGAYGRLLLEDDVHWANVIAMGLVPPGTVRDKENIFHTVIRDGAKTFYYAFLYGSGGEKSGRIVLDLCRLAIKKCGNEGRRLYLQFFGSDPAPSERTLKKVGYKLKNDFLERSPALQQIIERVRVRVGKGEVVRALDKRLLTIRSEHSAFNALLQSAGAILCKRWVVDAYHGLIAAGYKWGYDGDFVIVGWIHDEIQVACRAEIADDVGRIITEAARKAGEPYGFRMQLDSSYTVGNNWADTH